MELIGVIGSGSCEEGVRRLAYDVGAGVAQAGHAVICGGLGGVMEAACQGAKEAGGLTIGVLPGDTPDTANPYVEIPIATGLGVARNVIIVRSARVLIAVAGGPGTLSEIGFALQFGVPVVGLKTWEISPVIPQVATAREAVGEALSIIGNDK